MLQYSSGATNSDIDVFAVAAMAMDEAIKLASPSVQCPYCLGHGSREVLEDEIYREWLEEKAAEFGGWLESGFGFRLIFTRNGAALATAVMSFPLMVRAMRISLETVKAHLDSARDKLQALNRIHAVAKALRAGLIS